MKKTTTVYSTVAVYRGAIESYEATIEKRGLGTFAETKMPYRSERLGESVFLTKKEATDAALAFLKEERDAALKTAKDLDVLIKKFSK